MDSLSEDNNKAPPVDYLLPGVGMVPAGRLDEASRLEVAARAAIKAFAEVAGDAWTSSFLADEAERYRRAGGTKKSGGRPRSLREELFFLTVLGVVQERAPGLSAAQAARQMMQMVRSDQRRRWHSDEALAKRIVRARQSGLAPADLQKRVYAEMLVAEIEGALGVHAAHVFSALLEGRTASLSAAEKELGRVLVAAAAAGFRPDAETK